MGSSGLQAVQKSIYTFNENTNIITAKKIKSDCPRNFWKV